MGLSVQHAESEKVKNDTFCIFDLSSLFSDHMLLINISLSIVSLVYLDGGQGNTVIAQRLLTEAEMRMLLPLLENPTCCQPEVLQASCTCAYEFLLQVLIAPDGGTTKQWNELVQQQRERLSLASAKKTRRAEMRGVYNALFGLRQKLEQLGLTVRVRRDGYYLAPLAGESGNASVQRP